MLMHRNYFVASSSLFKDLAAKMRQDLWSQLQYLHGRAREALVWVLFMGTIHSLG
jgi:hypothetical protein